MAFRRPGINFKQGGGVTIAEADNSALDAVDVTFTAAVGTSGWTVGTADTLVYVSASQVKVTGADRTTIYQAGTLIRFKQGGGYKYMFVTSSSFSTDTTINVYGGTDYTVANAAITDNDYSYQANPQGWPRWFSYTPSFTGSVSNPTLGSGSTLSGGFSYIAGVITCHMVVVFGSSGAAAGSGAYSVSLPVNAVGTRWQGSAWLYDNSATLGRVAAVRTNDAAATTLLWVDSAVNLQVSDANPWTWAANDQLQIFVTYQV